MKKTVIVAALVAVSACAAGPLVSSAQASTVIPYPNVGVENSGTYTFTAINDGPVTAYFAGSAAGFSEVLGMTVNGIPTGITGLNDHSSVIGNSLVLGNVHAGDYDRFFRSNISTQYGRHLVFRPYIERKRRTARLFRYLRWVDRFHSPCTCRCYTCGRVCGLRRSEKRIRQQL